MAQGLRRGHGGPGRRGRDALGGGRPRAALDAQLLHAARRTSAPRSATRWSGCATGGATPPGRSAPTRTARPSTWPWAPSTSRGGRRGIPPVPCRPGSRIRSRCRRSADVLAGVDGDAAAYWSGGRSFDMRHVPAPSTCSVEGEQVPHQAVWVKAFDRLPGRPGPAARGPGLRLRLHHPGTAAAGARLRLGRPGPGHGQPGPRHVVPPRRPGGRLGALRPGSRLRPGQPRPGQGRFYDRQGRLLATVAQEGMIRTGCSVTALLDRQNGRFGAIDDAPLLSMTIRKAAMELTPSAHLDTFTRDHLPPGTNSGRRWSSPCRNCSTREQLNAATALIDDAVAQLRRRPPGPAHPRRQRPGATGNCSTAPTRWPRSSPRTSGSSPGNRVMLRAPNNPWLVAGLARACSRPAPWSSPPCRRCAPARSRTLLELTRPVAALCDHRFLDDLAEAAGDDVPVLAMGGSTGDGPRCTLRRQERRVHRRRHGGGRRRAARPDLGHHRDAEDHHALPPGHPRQRGHLRPAHPRSRPPDDVFAGSPPLAFTFGLGGLVVFPLRFGASALLTERATPVELAQAVPRCRGHRPLHRPDRLPGHPQGRAEGTCSRGLRIAVSAGEHLPRRPGRPSTNATGPEAGQRHRRHRNAARLHLRGRGRHPARRHGQGGPRLPGHDPGRGRQRELGPERRRAPGRHRPHRLPLPQRRPPGGLRRQRLERHRRHLHAGTRTATSTTRPAPTT